MDISKAILGTKKKDPIVEHESFSFETPQVSCLLSEAPELILFSTECSYLDHNLLLILVHKLFKRMVVDAFVYHKHCKSHSSTMVLTLQLEH